MIPFCSVAAPRLVYVGIGAREEFDRIALPVTEHDWEKSVGLTLLHKLAANDERTWERRCFSKTLVDEASGVRVIFQHFEERPAGGASS